MSKQEKWKVRGSAVVNPPVCALDLQAILTLGKLGRPFGDNFVVVRVAQKREIVSAVNIITFFNLFSYVI